MRQFLIPVAALALALPANAATLFSDDFEAEGPPNTLNYTGFANWTVTGRVDLVGMPNLFGITCTGNCVDLDGSSGPGSITSVAIAYGAGAPVTIQFDLSGSQRSTAFDGFDFIMSFAGPGLFSSGSTYFLPGFGAGSHPGFSGILSVGFLGSVAGNMPWGSFFYTFNPTSAGSVQLLFRTTSADNIGPLLDNVLVTQVPEPATWAMLIAGFGLVGTALRRRQPRAAAA